MRFGSRLTSAFYSGAPLSSLVPGVYPASLNGRPYMLMVDDSHPFRQATVPLLRQQADASNTPGEASINPEDLWRRSVESWHHGAGQASYDRPDSDPFRFRTSKGVDVWTQHALSLLPGTGQRLSSAATNLALAPAGSYLYVLDGAALKRTQDITVGSPTWTTVTGTPGGNIGSIATDGFNVWTQHTGANGIYATDRSTTVTAPYVTAAVSGPIGYAKGRLMAWDTATRSVYNIVATGALPTALLTVANSDFVAVGFAEGPSNIYMAGYSGDKSLLYRIGIKSDGTGLDVPVVSGRLPDGEIVRSIAGYLGFLLVGTDKGWRLVALSDAGDVATMSDLIPTASAVRCFEPQDRFVWYGLSNYDGSSTGLGRGDLSVFTKGLNPAYASDLMVAGQGAVLSVVTFQNQRVLAVSGLGVYTSTAALVSLGTLDGGLVGYGLSDPKVAMAVDVAHDPLTHGAHSAYLAVDSGAWNLIGRHFEGVTEGRFPCGQRSGERFEVRLSLERDEGTTTLGPTLTRSTFLAEPAPSRSYLWTLTLLLAEVETTFDGVERHRDVAADIDDIRSLVAGRNLVAFQSGNEARPVFVKDFQFDRHTPTEDGNAWQGPCTVLLKEPAT